MKATEEEISRVMAHLASRQKGKKASPKQLAARRKNAETARKAKDHTTITPENVTLTNCHSDFK